MSDAKEPDTKLPQRKLNGKVHLCVMITSITAVLLSVTSIILSMVTVVGHVENQRLQGSQDAEVTGLCRPCVSWSDRFSDNCCSEEANYLQKTLSMVCKRNIYIYLYINWTGYYCQHVPIFSAHH